MDTIAKGTDNYMSTDLCFIIWYVPYVFLSFLENKFESQNDGIDNKKK